MVLPITKLLIILSPERQGSSSLLQEHMYFIIQSGDICMLEPPYKNLFLSQGEHLAKQLSLSILSFLLQPIEFPLLSISQKSPTFCCKIPQLSCSIFLWAFQWSKFQLCYELFFYSLYSIVITFVLVFNIIDLERIKRC